MNLALLAVGRLIAVWALPPRHAGRITSPILFALAFALALPAQQPDPEVEALLGRSAEARDQGNLAESLRLMQEAYARAPAPELLNNVGYLLQLLGRYREAASVYRRAIEDPAADPELIRLDRERLEQLASKVDRAWVAVDDAIAPDLSIDGKPVDPALEELALGPGVHVLELVGSATVLRWTRFPLGERTAIDRGFFSNEDDAALVADIALESLRIDGYALTRLDFARVRLAAAEHQITVRIRDRGEVRITRTLERGSSVSIAEAFAPNVAPPPDEAFAVLPMVTVGLGVAALAAGTALAVLAGKDRSIVDHPVRNEEGLIVSPTYPEAQRLNRRANARATAGAVVLSGGGALVAVGVLWWFLE